MRPHVSLITLAVPDVPAVRDFYTQGLGWEPLVDTDDVVMISVGPALILSLWARESFAAEIGSVADTGASAPVALAHNVSSPAEVDEVLASAAAAGAVVRPATSRAWGGYSGYFADPAGFRWEVAHNPDPRFAGVVAV